mmetsp:Transcript_21391/g.29964  ORF Transcript_21391/g.29964 Transcript_21391/m.29964 type:complete len:100 (-) Transcript_21391:438-737(-)
MTFPESRHIISSALRMVDNRCAMTSTLDFTSLSTSLIAACTNASFLASKLEVASSRIKIRGRAIKALAIAMRCRCPPESLAPASPALVLYPSGNWDMNE